MKEQPDLPTGDAIGAAVETASNALDWRVQANRRLTRLVALEHDYSVMRDRLSLLQVDYRELLVAGEDQLQRIRELDKAHAQLNDRLNDLTREYADIQASRSWRLTRPLRALSTQAATGRRGVGRVLRALLRIPWLRRVARVVARLVPGLHERVRSRLYSQ
jgi:hypothetical protein